MKTKIIFIYVVPYGDAAWELNKLYALAMKNHGIEVAFLAKGINRTDDNTIPVHSYAFQDFRLDAATKKFILDFSPDIIHLCSPRFLALRVALEAMILTNAELVVKHEDEEIFIATQDYITVSPKKAFEYGMTSVLTPERMQKLFENAAWPFMMKEWLSKPSMMLAEPVSFALINHLASGLIGIWDNVTSELTQTYCKPAWTMPPTLDLSEIKPGPPDRIEIERAASELKIPAGKKILIFSGKYYPLIFDFDLLLQALGMSEIKNDKSWHFCVTGDNPHVERHHKLIKNAALEGRITWLGNLSKDHLDLAMRRADIAISPGIINEYNRVRLPQKNVMYMAYGKAVLTYSCGFGESLTDGENALLVNSDSPAEWARKLAILISDEKLRNKLAVNARDFAEKRFDCNAIAEGLSNFYHSIHANRKEDKSLLGMITDLESAGKQTFESPDFKRCKKLAVFGAGKHTVRLLNSRWAGHIKNKELVIVDDKPKAAELEGIKIINFSELKKWKPDGLLLSTDTFEDQMQARCLEEFVSGPVIFRIYTPSHRIYPALHHVEKTAERINPPVHDQGIDNPLRIFSAMSMLFEKPQISSELWSDSGITKTAVEALPVSNIESGLTGKLKKGQILFIESSCNNLNFAKYLNNLIESERADAFVVFQRANYGNMRELLWNDFRESVSGFLVSDWNAVRCSGFALRKNIDIQCS